MTSMRIAIATILAVGAIAAAVLTGSRTSPVVLRTFTTQSISFEYPSTWYVRPAYLTSSFAFALAKFSSQGFNVPCRYDSCWTPPGGHLEPGGVFGDWEGHGSPGASRAPIVRGQTVRIGRFNVRFDRKPAYDQCKAMSGTESLTILVPRLNPRDWYQVNACLRWPTSTTEAEIRRMLATANFPDLP
jgi:hypothetical protein